MGFKRQLDIRVLGRPVVLFCIVLLVAVCAISYWCYWRKERWDSLKAQSLFRCEVVGSEEVLFLEQVRKGWTLHSQGPVALPLLVTLSSQGFSSDVEGLAAFYSFKMSPYSFWNSSENSREFQRGQSLLEWQPEVDGAEAILFVSKDDGWFYYKPKSYMVSVFEDMDGKLVESLYVNEGALVL